MRFVVFLPLLVAASAVLSAATFGTVVSRAGGAAYSDIALDETRGKLYLVNPAASTIDVYSTSQKSFLSSDVYVPSSHVEGDAVPVTIKVGGVMSPTTGTLLPTIASH